MDTDEIRSQLEQMIRELDSASSTLEHEGATEDSELSHNDQHPADSATLLQDADRQAAIIEAAADQRAQVEAALARLDAGTYGTCLDCGAQIPAARLLARPEAARCVTCQGKAEDAA
ncbi:MAG TPA: TraR/DksA C4-type zinc finger protein [Mycobacteriales bacterium]|nr:TraR/DksA C4-type zinc finger protein [Mycobacteriales bacterium]